MAEEQQQDVKTLKRRGRRRLLGAVALVLLAFIVLPMIFDPAPKSTLAPANVQIPPVQNAGTFAPKPAPKAAAAKPQSATPPGDQYVVQVGAFLHPQSVLAKLAGAKLPYYTEPAQGQLTRIRAGPFANREAADQAVAKLKELGLTPGAVTAKSG
jgi:DedD protein